MERPALELADVFRRHGEAYLREHAAHLGRAERRVMGAIAACRTTALGGHVERCDDCGLTRVAYNSCRNRHCPKCQGAARAAWLDGVSLDGNRWIARILGFLLPVKALARLFRRLFLAGLEAAFEKGALRFFGDLAPLAELSAFAERVISLRKPDWIVYAKPPFGGPSLVLAYLARYTHRAAIANSRLVAIDNQEVAFTYKDYRRNSRRKVMRLCADEFIRRFLLHVLPDGFHRIRHYGFHAKGDRKEKLERCRSLAAAQAPYGQTDEPDLARFSDEPEVKRDAVLCADCGGLMRRVGDVAPIRSSPFRCDTS
ncbi:IS91 family transposase [Methylocystis sp. MitZ-2018]|nr:IS91 family transposase [Methylocystis sp. MitZ-2018]